MLVSIPRRPSSCNERDASSRAERAQARLTGLYVYETHSSGAGAGITWVIEPWGRT